MGLSKRRDSGLRGWLPPVVHWRVALLLIGVCVVIAAFGDPGREWLKYDRPAIEAGELWRLITGHFTHLNGSHLVLNLAGLVLTWLLVGRNYRPGQWLLVILSSVCVISAGFWYLDPDIRWYVGLSGVLHGLLFAGAIRGIRAVPFESIMICVLVAGKLVYEQVSGPLPGSESVSGGYVVVDAHLYGSIGGLIAAMILWRSAGAATSL